MFADLPADRMVSIDCPSSWRQERSVREGGCQTEPSTTSEASTQARGRAEAAVQVQQQQQQQARGAEEVDGRRLAQFVAQAATLMEMEMDIAATSRAWDGYTLIVSAQCCVHPFRPDCKKFF